MNHGQLEESSKTSTARGGRSGPLIEWSQSLHDMLVCFTDTSLI
jgi:hypothetical protein